MVTLVPSAMPSGGTSEELSLEELPRVASQGRNKQQYNS